MRVGGGRDSMALPARVRSRIHPRLWTSKSLLSRKHGVSYRLRVCPSLPAIPSHFSDSHADALDRQIASWMCCLPLQPRTPSLQSGLSA